MPVNPLRGPLAKFRRPGTSRPDESAANTDADAVGGAMSGDAPADPEEIPAAASVVEKYPLTANGATTGAEPTVAATEEPAPPVAPPPASRLPAVLKRRATRPDAAPPAAAPVADEEENPDIAIWRLRRLTPEGTLTPPVTPARLEPATPHWERTPEEFFHLYAGLERMAADRRVIGVTSAVRGEGKTTVALHLALSAVRSTDLRICLIDLSLGDDDLSRRLAIDPAPGGVIAEVEEGGPLAVLECRGVAQRLAIVPAADSPENSARTARSARTAALVEALRGEYDLLILDLPAIQTNNALPLLALTDGVLLVTRAGATPRSVVRAGLDLIDREKLIGAVLNRVTSAKLAEGVLERRRRDRRRPST